MTKKTGKGLVRHIMGRVGVHSGEVMAVIITSGYDIPHRGVLIEWLKRYVPGLVSVVQNINKKQTNVVMGSKTRVLYGPESIKDNLGSLSFQISAQAFFQVNSEQAEKLYNKALEFAALSGKETVVDVTVVPVQSPCILRATPNRFMVSKLWRLRLKTPRKMPRRINALMRNLSAVMRRWSCRSCWPVVCVRTWLW